VLGAWLLLFAWLEERRRHRAAAARTAAEGA
jgi:hypothetical protein